jgi:hypothetical protein
MKKNILLVAGLLFAGSAIAQTTTMTSKNGHEILPQAGDIAIGMDAVPFANFFLNSINIMNNTGQQAQHPGYVGGFNQVIVGKYFLDESTAVRARLGINTLSTTTTTFFDNPIDVSNGVASPGELSDVNKMSTSSIVLGGGLEMRRGHNRLQGFYGGELLIAKGGNKMKNEYGQEYSQAAEDAGYMGLGDSRLLNSKTGSFGLGLRGFAGVEYFFAPKISIGAEFGWGLGMMSSGRGKSTIETWDLVGTATSGSVTTEDIDGPSKMSMFGFGVDNGSVGGAIFGGSAALMLTFHF